MVYYDHSIAVIDTGEDKTEDRRYDSGILQKESAYPRVTFASVRQTVEQNGTRSPQGEERMPVARYNRKRRIVFAENKHGVCVCPGEIAFLPGLSYTA